MYEKQVHKDGIKRVLLSSDRSTARYFNQSELADLFKLAPCGECSMMDKFNEKSNNDAPGSSGKRSFLSKHPSVVGVASHDALYASSTVDVDLTSSRSTKETPYSRSPFQKSKIAKKYSSDIQVEDLTDEVEHPRTTSLGGFNRTRQNREDAKVKRNQQNATLSTPLGPIGGVLNEVDGYIMDRQYGRAMTTLLELVETDMDSIRRDEKMAVHENISHVACLLGWL